MKPLVEKILMFFFKILFPSKYALYIKRKVEEEQRRIEEQKRLEEERKNIEQFAMVGGTEFRNNSNKTKIDNIKGSLTFCLKKKTTGRVIVVKGSSFEDVKREYGDQYDFVEPMLKSSNDEWDENGIRWNEDLNSRGQCWKTETI